jgi:hypothetical protein
MVQLLCLSTKIIRLFPTMLLCIFSKYINRFVYSSDIYSIFVRNFKTFQRMALVLFPLEKSAGPSSYIRTIQYSTLRHKQGNKHK